MDTELLEMDEWNGNDRNAKLAYYSFHDFVIKRGFDFKSFEKGEREVEV